MAINCCLGFALTVVLALTRPTAARSRRCKATQIGMGDSVMDNGIYQDIFLQHFASPSPLPPYDPNGALSNGPALFSRIVELLPRRLRNRASPNYSVNGAMARASSVVKEQVIFHPSIDPMYTVVVDGLPNMVAQYLADTAGQDRGHHVILIAVSNNDLFRDVAGPIHMYSSAQDVTDRYDAITASIKDNFKRLHEAGVGRVIIDNAIPLQKTPCVKALTQQQPPLISWADVTVGYNKALAKKAEGWNREYPGFVVLHDAYEARRGAQRAYAAAGNEVNVPCLDAVKYFRGWYTPDGKHRDSGSVSQGTIDGMACAHPEEYLYWDGFHPTTSAHRDIAKLYMDTVVDALKAVCA